MKLRFEADLDFQLAAVEAVCGLFSGMAKEESPLAAAGNRLGLSSEALLGNLQAVQSAGGLPPSPSLGESDDLDFTVEMETGTGKTYVYLRTLFELHQRYGFGKFVIVVPSVAVKEGVHKTLAITREHFRCLYAGLAANAFQYDSARLARVRAFAHDPGIQVMIVTVAAINKMGRGGQAGRRQAGVNNFYKDSEHTGGERPVDLIRRTRPIVIVDEPQSVDGGLDGQGRKALAAMHPLCTLRYSATHVHKHHMIHRLDAVDAYRRGLVKRIEIASLAVSDPDAASAAVGVGDDAVKRLMIRRVIQEHLDKERRLLPRGVKVLTLFFVDRVAHYRVHTPGRPPTKGKYALMFEEEYARAMALTRHRDIDTGAEPAEVHDGYFSEDRKGHWSDTSEDDRTGRERAERAYRLIMRDKETLLGLDCKLRFLFSHSALREGWDNPNVFQICVLRDVESPLSRRQMLGRGLRLCVDHDGARLRNPDLNILTVIASEPYERFADGLQRELAAETDDGKRCRHIAVRNADERRDIPVRPEILDSADFRELWERIRRRSEFTVDFDPAGLVRECAAALDRLPRLAGVTVDEQKAAVTLGRGGVGAKALDGGQVHRIAGGEAAGLPDILTQLTEKTRLTRKSLASILSASRRMDDFLANPQRFVHLAGEAINRVKSLVLVAGVRYRVLPDSGYPLSSFVDQTGIAYLGDCLPSRKSLYSLVACGSRGEERAFVRELEDNPAVLLYVKLPSWYAIPTPLGRYTPDWALAIKGNDGGRRYYVAAAEGEGAAMARCGEAHFRAMAGSLALPNPVRFLRIRTLADIIGYC